MPTQTFILNGKQRHRRRRTTTCGCCGCCATCSASPARSTAAASTSARPAPRTSTARRSTPARCRSADLEPDRRGHHDRGPARHGRRGPAPDAAGLARPRRRPVRLLPARPDHGGGRAGPARYAAEGREITEPTSTRSATSAAAAPTPGSARRSARASARCELSRARRGGDPERAAPARARTRPRSGRRAAPRSGCTIASPRPVPGWATASGLEERKNSVNSWAWSSAEMPMPSSQQVSTTWSPTRASRTVDVAALGGVLHRVADQVGADAGPARRRRRWRAPAPSGASTRTVDGPCAGRRPRSGRPTSSTIRRRSTGAGDHRVVRVADLGEQQQVLDHPRPGARRRGPWRPATCGRRRQVGSTASSISRWPTIAVSGFFSSWETVAISWLL